MLRLSVPLPSRKGGKEGCEAVPEGAATLATSQTHPASNGDGKGPRGRLFSRGIGSTLRGNLNRVVFENRRKIPLSLFLYIYIYICFGAKSRTSSNELERSEDSW